MMKLVILSVIITFFYAGTISAMYQGQHELMVNGEPIALTYNLRRAAFLIEHHKWGAFLSYLSNLDEEILYAYRDAFRQILDDAHEILLEDIYSNGLTEARKRLHNMFELMKIKLDEIYRDGLDSPEIV